MAAIANSFDRILQSSVPRFAVPTDRAFFVNPEAAIFQVTNGIASPSSFNFTPTLLNMAGTVSYVPSAGLAIAVSGNNFSLAYSDMTVAAGSVMATLVDDGVTYTRTIPVSRIVDGVAPKILDLAASSQVFKVDKAGVGSPGSIELIAYAQNLAGTPNFTVTAGTATLAIGSDNTRKQLTFANMASDLVQVTVTQDGQTDTITIVKVREGADGSSATTAFLTNESQTIPANLDGTTISMAGASTTMKVYLGTADDSANWTYTASPASSAAAITYTLGAANGVLTASAISASVDAAYVDITAARQGYASVTKRFSLSKSKTGPQGLTGVTGTRGNVNLSVVTSGTAWSDSEANAAVLSMTGTAARSRDVVNLYRADRTWAQKRIFDGFNWSILADAFDGSILVKGTVLADALDTRGLTVKDLQGNVLLGVGTPLAASLAAAGTLNSDIVIGGRNLFTRTSVFSDPASPVTGAYATERTADGFAVVGVGTNNGFQRLSLPGGLAVGAYTLSFFMRNRDSAGPISISLGGAAAQVVNGTTTTARYELHFAVTDATKAWIDFSNLTAQAFYFSKFMPVSGTKAFDYAPAPEDVAADTAAVKTIAVSAGGLTLIGRNGITVVGNGATKTSGAAEWFGDVYSKDGYTGGALVTAVVPANAYIIFGFNTDPLTSSGFDTLDYAIETTEDGQIARIINGGSGGFIGTYLPATDVLGMAYNGQSVQWLKNGVVLSSVAATITAPLYFDSAFFTVGGSLSNITFSPLTSNAWSAVGGLGKPADYATVGATIGVNLLGQITAANAAALVGANAITNTMIGGDLFSTNWNGGTDSGGAGWALARNGTLYCNDGRFRGTLSGGAFTPDYAWPSGTGIGFHLSASGLLLGNPSTNKYVQIDGTGDVRMPGFRVISAQVYVDNPIITGGVLDAFYSNNSGGGINGSYANGSSTYGTLTMSVVGGRAPFSYYWFINLGNASGSVKVRIAFQGGTPTGPTATIQGTGTNDDLDGTVMCICIDANSRAITAAFPFYVKHGTPP